MIRRVMLAGLCFSAFGAVAPAQTITWAEHIAPILYGNCTTCHHPGTVAPFSLMTYQDAYTHGLTAAARTQAHYMPPWKPDTIYTPLAGVRGLTDAQIALIQQWVAGGMQQGDVSKAPAPPVYPTGWTLGQPDLILTMPKGYNVSANGQDVYRDFVFQTGLTQDTYVRAVEYKPSAYAVVHHVLFLTDSSGVARASDGSDGQPGFDGLGTFGSSLATPQNLLTGGLGVWVPGTTAQSLPTGAAYFLPAGADIVVQTHFHPNGAPNTEQSTIGIYYAPKPPRDLTQIQVPAVFGSQAGIDIPAGMSDYMLRGSYTLPVAVDAVSVLAHMHYLGKGARLTATKPDGTVQVLLSIRQWDLNWQDTYTFQNPVSLPAGTRLDAEILYDNSANNPANPFSPPQEVKWGEFSTQEMGTLALNVLPSQQSNSLLLRTSVLLSAAVKGVSPGARPQFISAGVVDAASATPGPVSPGKIVVLYGHNLAPAGLALGSYDQTGKLATTTSGTQLLFDGVPAPILYTTAGQVSAIVPYSVDGKAGTQVQLISGSGRSDTVAVPVAATAPGLFSANQSGSGQGAFLNADLSANSSANPAAQGSIVVLYATGEGQTSPAGVDGQLANAVYPKPKQPVSVTVGGQPAQVLYYGAAPYLVAGVMQLNIQLPAGLPSGDNTVVVTVGSAQSQAGITVAVK